MGYRRFYRAYLRAALWIASVTALIMVLNCFIQYHCTPLEESLQGYGRQYSTEDLAELRDMIVEQANTLAEQGKTPLLFALDGKLCGMIAVADPIKQDSAQAIRELRNMGIRTVMLTGDNERTAGAVSEQAGVDQVCR